jgi:hypothetical protein
MGKMDSVDPFHEGVKWAITRIINQIDEVDWGGDINVQKALERRDARKAMAAYKAGANDGYSRAESRPGYGDMGG